MGNDHSSFKYNSPFYSIYRKIRYLKRRGTLFRKRPDSIKKTARSRKKGTIRKILFLIRRGRIFKKNTVSRSWDTKHSAGSFHYASDIAAPADHTKYGNKSYRTYRKVRFLLSTGKLFKRKPVTAEPSVEKTKRNIYRKVRFIVRKKSITGFSLFGLRRTLREGLAFLGDQNYVYILVNSTVLFLFAYLFVYLLTQLAVVAAAATFNIDTVLYYYDVDFLIRAREWLPDAVKVVYSSGPFAALIIAILSFIVYAHMTEENTVVRLFILWVFCHAFIHFFGEMLMGSLIGGGIGYVVMFLYFTDTSKMVFSVFDFVFIIFTGFAMSRLFLFSGEHLFRGVKPRKQESVHAFPIPSAFHHRNPDHYTPEITQGIRA